MVEQTITGTAAPAAVPVVAHGHPVNLLKVLGPIHVWALGVGIVLVGEYMGWNFSVAKGGALGALIACWIVGLLYTCVAMIDSEVTSTVAAAGGQYTQAKHIIGPLMAFNVGLYLVLAYTMLEAGDAITAGYLIVSGRAAGGLRRARPEAVHRPDHHGAGLAQLSRRVRDADLQPHHHGDRLPVIVVLFLAVSPGTDTSCRRCAIRRPALWLDRRDRGAAISACGTTSASRDDAGGRRGPLAGRGAAARHHDRHDHAAHRGDDDLVHLRRPDAVGVSGTGRSRRSSTRRGSPAPGAHGRCCSSAPSLRRRLGQRVHQRCVARLVRHGARPLPAGVVRRGASPVPHAVPLDRVPHADRALLRAQARRWIRWSPSRSCRACSAYTFMSINIFMFRRKWPLGVIRRGYVHPFHPIPAFVLLCLCAVTYFAVFLGYGT